jgi:2-oxoglutarate ferredoxin oxidoreductase subunit alpha
LAGEAGQGIAGAGDLLGKTATRSGYRVYAHNDAESRVRGGLNFNHLRICTADRQGIIARTDMLVALSEAAVTQFSGLLAADGVLLCNEDWAPQRRAPFLLNELAKESGSAKTAGTVGVAAVCALIGLEESLLREVVGERFAGRNKVLEANLEAVKKGYRTAKSWAQSQKNGWRTARTLASPAEKRRSLCWLQGAEAVALGALAGGVQFMTAYPMSPATGIIINLARWAEQAETVVVQAEDEVGAINMVAGASYAGARAMTATSGGGFALMVEGVSLLGMIEAPAVIVVAQRPGPATGLPTRQAQSDLGFVLHGGHGYFPRIIVAPRDVAHCFDMTARAFEWAEKYQVPVFVLTDQHLQDSHASLPPFDTEGISRKRYFLSPDALEGLERYDRYALTEDGISPLAAPGASHHTVYADSDEHSEAGHPIEDGETARKMVEKRQRKAKTVSSIAEPPTVRGDPAGRTVVVSWGGTHASVGEAVDRINADEAQNGKKKPLVHAHLHWLWPPPEAAWQKLADQAGRLVFVENDVEGQAALVWHRVTGKKPVTVITKCDGRPFAVAELVERIAKEVG